MATPYTRPVIAVDIDDVLFPFIEGLAEYHNGLKGTQLTADDFTTYHLREVWGGTQEETEEIVHAFLAADRLHLQPCDGVKQALERLSADFDVVLVTARNQAFEAPTVTWLRHHLPDLFADVMFAGNPYDGRPYRPKGLICQELGARLLIDDHPSNLLSAAECGIDGILFGSKAWSVLETPVSRIVPCSDWDAVLRYVYDEWRQPV